MFLSFDIGLRNLAACKLTVDTATKEFAIRQWEVLSAVPDDLNVNKTPIEDLCPLFSTLCYAHVADWIHNVDTVFIESQPMGRTRNLKTKVLSHILQTILLKAGQDAGRTLTIQFVHPTLKLKNMVGERTYRKNKAFAVQETDRLLRDALNQAPEAQGLFIGKKRDDLADCFLQGYLACWCEPKKERKVLKVTKTHERRNTTPKGRPRTEDATEHRLD